MIRSFRDRETKRIWRGQVSKRLPPGIQGTARRKLRMLNNATTLNDLLVPPANRLEALKGNRLGEHSIRINGQWRVGLTWWDGHANQVEIVDYH